VQQTDYYPFGMEIASYSSGVENRYRYNGKEKQNDLIGGKAWTGMITGQGCITRL
jgi:hypothetical protein